MLNFIKKYQYHIILILLFIFFVTISAINYSNAVFSDISSSIFRLHVIANSDTEGDQELKLKVRDSVLEYINSHTSNINTKEEFIEFANYHIDKITKVAENRIKEEGYNYPVSVEIGNFYFPKKEYENISFPSGNYDGIKIKIGKAEGQNWWCVMFPPLCLLDNTTCKMEEKSINILKNNLSEEELSIISENSFDIKLKFKIIELFN
ncbi:MAG: stage II sporulation protein R [Clostridia bacterium]|nr:stage II sporulation protein R [Clostridia bacterium]MBR3152217.1 stage II sporulation protein R [Clostridia bacterium]MBR3152246.1 stage II sporulation protein R [Clostridia bacterium]